MEKNLKKCVYIYMHVHTHTHTHARVHTHTYIYVHMYPGGSVVKNMPGNAEDAGSIPGSGRSPAERNGNPLQYSCLGNPMNSRAWRATAQFSSVQLLSRVRLFETPWTTARQASLSITNSQSLPKLMSIESVMPSNHLILHHALLLLPSIFPSIRVFSNESILCIRWPKYWSFSFSISPSNEHPGLISFRMDWLDLLAVHWTLKTRGVIKDGHNLATIITTKTVIYLCACMLSCVWLFVTPWTVAQQAPLSMGFSRQAY